MSAAPRLKVAAGGGALLLAVACATTACGRQGPLLRPAPMFGDQARADYRASQDERSRSAQRRAARRNGTAQPAGASTDPNQTDSSTVDPDNRPATTRDVQDPAQQLSPLSSSPVPGAPNPLGSPVQTTSPY